jgi:hypothetical protein
VILDHLASISKGLAPRLPLSRTLGNELPRGSIATTKTLVDPAYSSMTKPPDATLCVCTDQASDIAETENAVQSRISIHSVPSTRTPSVKAACRSFLENSLVRQFDECPSPPEACSLHDPDLRNEINLEVNFVVRGTVRKVQLASLSTKARNILQAELKIPMASLEDIYVGKLVAALDRQHPRDLFDLMQLYANEGITPAMRRGFVVYLASHNRSAA